MKLVVKLGIVIVLIVGCVIGVHGYLVAKLEADSRVIGDVVKDLFVSDTLTIPDGLPKGMKSDLTVYYNGLKSKDNAQYTIDYAGQTAVDDTIEGVDDGDTGVVEVPGAETTVEGSVPETETVPEVQIPVEVKQDTPNLIIKSDTEVAIKVNDLVFSENNYAEIVYKGVPFGIFKSDVPETYQMILNNPIYNYKFERTEKVKEAYIVHYKSVVNTEKLLRVIVKNNGFKVTQFEVKQN